MNPVLEVQDVAKIIPFPQGDTAILQDISFAVYPGEAVGIIGASGAGKSTIAKIVSRLSEATSGTISFLGEDITSAKGKRLRKVYENLQMVFQTPQTTFDPRRTLVEGIGESLRNQGLTPDTCNEKVGALLRQCGLEPVFASKYPSEVSGGQCQRASIARALAVQPQLLICDEATSSLDVTLQAQIMTLLQQLKAEEHMAFLFITHNIALAKGFCDRLLVMHDGRIVEEGKTADILACPQAPYTRELVASVV